MGIFGHSVNSVCVYIAYWHGTGRHKRADWYILSKAFFNVGLNVITEFVAGYMFPGRPLANMMIKVYGYMTMARVSPALDMLLT